MKAALLLFAVLAIAATAFAAAPALYGLIGNAQGTVCTLTTLDPSNGQWKLIKDLSSFGGSIGEFQVDWKNRVFYMTSISMTNLNNYLYKVDLKGNLLVNLSTLDPIMNMEMDVALGTFSASVDLVKKVPDIVQIDFTQKTVTTKIDFPGTIQVEGVGLSGYIQANHTLLIVIADSSGTNPQLAYIDTQKWTVTQKLNWPYMTLAMVYDDASSTLYQTAFNPKTYGVDIIAVSLPSLKATTIYSYKQFCCTAGANAFDSKSGLYYVALQDSGGDNYMVTIDTKAKKSLAVVAVDYFPYAFVLWAL